MSRLSTVKIAVGLIALLLTGAGTAAAQDSKADFSVGYQLLRPTGEAGDEIGTLTRGFYVDLSGNVTPAVGIVGKFAGNYKSFDIARLNVANISFYRFMGGIRFNAQGASVRPFVQVLGGGIRAGARIAEFGDSETRGAFEVGAGINGMITGALGVRVGAAYLRILGKGGDEGGNAVEANAGIVISFR